MTGSIVCSFINKFVNFPMKKKWSSLSLVSFFINRTVKANGIIRLENFYVDIFLKNCSA